MQVPDFIEEDGKLVQYAVLNKLGTHVFGDQNWVKDGRAACDGTGPAVTIVREVTVTYGEWKLCPDPATMQVT